MRFRVLHARRAEGLAAGFGSLFFLLVRRLQVRTVGGRRVVAAIEGAGGLARFIAGDVRFAAECERIVTETLSAFGGRLDILFNNAGVYFPHDAVECTEEEWDQTIDISLKGSWLMSKYALPAMIARRSGVIIHQSSGWGIQGGDKAVAYCAAKGGIVVMTKAMAIDHGPQGIRVNCICPGDVDTPMLAAEAEARHLDYAVYMKGAANRPLGRVGLPEEIARAALFLASDESSFVTGASVVVDGGGIAG